MTQPLVVDIYHGNIVTDFAAVKAQGVVGLIHKASQGSSSVDGAYAARRPAALAAGLLWGAYHFLDLSDPEAQAEHFLSVANADENTLIALDWETVGNKQPSLEIARAFLTEVQNELGRSAVIYSGNVAKEQIKNTDAFFGAHRLWLAQYGVHWAVQPSWQKPWLWQNNGDLTGPGPHYLRGLKGPVDNSTVVPDVDAKTITGEWAA